jgi:hypothetical protein
MRPVRRNRTAGFLASSASKSRDPGIAALTMLWDAPWCALDCFGGDDLARDMLTHLGTNRSADVGVGIHIRNAS